MDIGLRSPKAKKAAAAAAAAAAGLLGSRTILRAMYIYNDCRSLLLGRSLRSDCILTEPDENDYSGVDDSDYDGGDYIDYDDNGLRDIKTDTEKKTANSVVSSGNPTAPASEPSTSLQSPEVHRRNLLLPILIRFVAYFSISISSSDY